MTYRIMDDTSTKCRQCEPTLTGTMATTIRDVVSLFIKCVVAAHTDIETAKKSPVTGVKDDSEDASHQPQLLLKPINNLSETKSEFDGVFADLGVVTKANMHLIFETDVLN